MSNVQDDVVRMFEQGLSVPAIADATNVPVTGVIGTLMRRGVYRPDAATEKTLEETQFKHIVSSVGPEVREAVLREYRGFLGIPSIGRRYGLTQAQVWKVLIAEGEPLRGQPCISLTQAGQRRDEEILSLRKIGVPITDISLLVGVSDSHIYRVLQKSPEDDHRLGEHISFRDNIDSARRKKISELMRNPKIQQILLLTRELHEEQFPVLVLPPALLKKEVKVPCGGLVVAPKGSGSEH